MDERPIEEITDEEFISAGHRSSDIAESHGGAVRLCVREFAAGRDHYTDHVQSEGERVKLNWECLAQGCINKC